MGPGGLSGTTFRRAVKDDLDDLLKIAQITQNEHAERLPQVFTKDKEAASAMYLRAAVETAGRPATIRDAAAIVAEQDGRILGYVAYIAVLEPHDLDRHGVVGTIADISIVPDHRRSGLGRQLLDRAARALDELEVTVIHAQVWTGNAASERLFSGSGFSPHFRQFNRQLRPWIDAPFPARRLHWKGRLKYLTSLLVPPLLVIAGLTLIRLLLSR